MFVPDKLNPAGRGRSIMSCTGIAASVFGLLLAGALGLFGVEVATSGSASATTPSQPVIDTQTSCNGPFGVLDVQVENSSTNTQDITLEITTPSSTHLAHTFSSLPSGQLSSTFHLAPADDGTFALTATSSDQTQDVAHSSASIDCSANAGSGTATATGTRDCGTGAVTGTVSVTDIVEPKSSGGGTYSGPVNVIGAGSVIASGNADDGSVSIDYTFAPGPGATSFTLDAENGTGGYFDIPVTVQLAPCPSGSPTSGGASSSAGPSGGSSSSSGSAGPTDDPSSSSLSADPTSGGQSSTAAQAGQPSSTRSSLRSSSGAAPSATSLPASLASTGVPSSGLLIAALALTLAGTAVAVAGRGRRHGRHA